MYYQKYLKYKNKYIELKQQGGTITNPAMSIHRDMYNKNSNNTTPGTGNITTIQRNIKGWYDNPSTVSLDSLVKDLDSNNFSSELISILNTFIRGSKFNDYIKTVYNLGIVDDGLAKKIFELSNLKYVPNGIKGYAPNVYPYGTNHLSNYLSYTNHTFYMIENGIYESTGGYMKLRELTLRESSTAALGPTPEYKFIECVRFEKIADDIDGMKTKFVLQDKKSEIESTPGFIIKGVYFYPCLGSGTFINYKNALYGLNKLDIISRLHDEAKRTGLLECSSTHGARSHPLCNYSNRLKLKTVKDINGNKIVEELIKKLHNGLFDTKDSIFASNLGFVCTIHKLDHLKENKLLKSLLNNKVFNIREETAYENYYKTFSGTLKISELLVLYSSLVEIHIAGRSYKDNILDFVAELGSIATSLGVDDISLKTILCNKEYFKDFAFNRHYLSDYYQDHKFFKSVEIKLNREKVLYNLMIEFYSQIYNANFNQIYLDATMYYYAKLCGYDTIILTHEPTDKDNIFGSEIIAVEELQIDAFNRTFNCRINDSNRAQVIEYLNKFSI